MTMQYDVKALSLANAQANVVYDGPTRVKALTVSYDANATVVLKDGGANGADKLFFAAPNATGSVHILIPGEGVRCEANLFANAVGATALVFYG